MAFKSAPIVDGPVTVYLGDVRQVLALLPDESVNCVVTSPPYWGLRDYGVPGQLGLEPTPEAYVESMVGVFADVRRVLRRDGTLWLNLGDSYAGGGRAGSDKAFSGKQGSNRGSRAMIGRPFTLPNLDSKQLIGIPWRIAFALQADGWWLRSDIIWSKPNPMPESVTDRPTKAHEYLFLLAKSERYYYDAEAIREAALWPDGPNAPDAITSPYGQGFTRRASGGRQARRYDAEQFKTTEERNTRFQGPNPVDGGRNRRSVWTIATQPYPDAHFATFPEALVEPCIQAGCPEGGTVLDPFAGSGTTLAVARRLGRKAIGIELQPTYVPLIERRVEKAAMPLVEAMN